MADTQPGALSEGQLFEAVAWARACVQPSGIDALRSLEGHITALQATIAAKDAEIARLTKAVAEQFDRADAALSGTTPPADALAILQDWRSTPGNRRTAAWWDQWTARMEAVTVHPGDLTAHKGNDNG